MEMIDLKYKCFLKRRENKGENKLRGFYDNFLFLGGKKAVAYRKRVILISLLIGLLSAFLVSAREQPHSVENDFYPAERLEGFYIIDEGKIPLYWEKKLIEEIAWEVATEREYKLHVYDCTQFSKKLKRELQKEGFKTQCTAGRYLGETNYPDHTWVSVFINETRIEVEATNGFVIRPEEFEEFYNKKWEDLCR